MVNRCYIGGTIVSKFNLKKSVNGREKLNFILCHRREYKETGKYKNDFIIIDCWLEPVIKYVKENFVVGDRVVIEGQFKIDSKNDEKGKYKAIRTYIQMQAIHPISCAKSDEEESIDEDYDAIPSQISWGDNF